MKNANVPNEKIFPLPWDSERPKQATNWKGIMQERRRLRDELRAKKQLEKQQADGGTS